MPVGTSTEEIYQGALKVGMKRLEEFNLVILVSAFIAGPDVALGG